MLYINEIENFDKLIVSILPNISLTKIFIKPNLVMHQTYDAFPIEALVTNSKLIDLTIQACILKYPNIEQILIGDVPLQTCEWDKLIQQTGIDKLIDKYKKYKKPQISFVDLRKERFKLDNGYMTLVSDIQGDPSGYVEVILNEESFLEEISKNSSRFRVSDYDPKETTSVHKLGEHKYLICKSILEADLLINMPKMKTHQKSGITGALKNLVGINGSKAYLVHHQQGLPSQGGDEFPQDVSRIVLFQVRFRDILQKKSKIIFKVFKFGWEVLKKIVGIKTMVTNINANNGKLYVGPGSWYGNDSVWRMIYDLNKIIMFATPMGGVLSDKKQRHYLCILDGIISGEGNGPLQPIPVKTNKIVISDNPFLIDFAISKMMGYDWQKIPQLKSKTIFGYDKWTDFDPYDFKVQIDSKVYEDGINSIPVIKPFIPAPGWKNHIEL